MREQRNLLESLLDIFACLTALSHFYRFLHWSAKGENFYSDHKMFERIYGKIPDEIDGLAEYIVALYPSDVLNPLATWNRATEFINGLDSEIPMNAVRGLEKVLLEIIDEAVSFSKNKSPHSGLENFLSGLSQTHQGEIGYLLRQRNAR